MLGAACWKRKRAQPGVSLKKIPEEDLQRVASEYGCARVEDLYADLGYGKWSARQVLAKATGQPLPEAARGRKQPKARLHRQAHARHRRRRPFWFAATAI